MTPVNWRQITYHDLSKTFREMTKEEFAALKDDIRVNGMKEPIVLFAGKVLDGRNRFRACLELEVEGQLPNGSPVFTEFLGTYEEAESEAISKNFMRRHLTKSEKAMFLVLNGKIKLPPADGSRRESGSGRDNIIRVGRKFGVNHMTLYKAAYIASKDPTLAQDVADGKKSVPMADKELRERLIKAAPEQVGLRSIESMKKALREFEEKEVPGAIAQWEDWKRSETISDSQWATLIDWLILSPFNDKTYIAGEAGARLINERAPLTVLDRFVSTPANKNWVLLFQIVAVLGKNHPLKASLLEKARNDSNLIVRSFALSCDQPMPAAKNISHPTSPAEMAKGSGDSDKQSGNTPALFLVLRHSGHPAFAIRLEMGDLTIGRADENDISLQLNTISRMHAKLSVGSQGVIVSDVGSRNGTWVNRKRINCAVVYPGEIIQLGNVQLTLSRDPSGVDNQTSEEDTGEIKAFASNDQQLSISLSRAQMVVFDLLVKGNTEKEIAIKLGRSIETVHNHTRKIYEAYEVHSRTELLLKVMPRQ